MTNINAINFENNLSDYLNQAVMYNDVVNVATKNGNAVIISEEDYSGMVETLYLLSHKKTVAEILNSMEEQVFDGYVYVPGEEW